MSWLNHPTVAERYAAFRASLNIKTTPHFALPSHRGEPETPAPRPRADTRSRVRNSIRRKTD